MEPKTIKAYKYSIDYTGEWYVNKFFDFKIENAFYIDNLLVIESLDKDFLVLSHIVKFQYLGCFEVELLEYGQVKEVRKINEEE